MVDKKTIIASLLLVILLVPIASAYAENFTVTTNKDIYALDENVIVVGVIPSDSPDGYAILLKVTGPDGKDCTIQNILPAPDGSFVSRPIKTGGCGFGDYSVSAFYADLKSASTFAVSNSSETDAGSALELRLIRNVVLQAQDTVNARVQELIDANYVLPEDIADKYSKGVSETSLAVQAIDFGDSGEAKKHVIFAIRDFREVMDELSSGRLALFEQTAEQQAEAKDDHAASLIETYNRLQEFYSRLEDLAEKNQVDKEREFTTASSLLASSLQMIDDGNLEGAEQRLSQVNRLLESIRTELFQGEEDQDQKSATYATNNTESNEARRLINVADKFEQRALRLLNETSSGSEAEAKVREALSLIANARSSIDQQDYDSARESLSSAYKALNEARNLIEDAEHEDNSGSSSSGSNGDHDDNDESGKGNEGSGNGGNSTGGNEGHQ